MSADPHSAPRDRAKGCCRTCHRAIWYAAAYQRWLHRKPGTAYRSNANFGGGRHDAEPAT